MKNVAVRKLLRNLSWHTIFFLSNHNVHYIQPFNIFFRFQFPQELYLHALYVIHRLLSYQKRSRVRVPYPWKELWTSLISLLKFLTSNETALVKKMDVFTVALQVTVIFNLFITYGDTFLPSPSSYDELYYELVRCHTTFDALYSMALRYSTSGGEHKVRKLKAVD